PGVNTVGMLLAHIAVAEAFWINVAPAEIPLEQDCDNLILKVIGIRMDDDGLPLKPDGHHPLTLSGKTLADYLNILDKMRAATNATIRTWHDTDLDNSFTLRDAPVTRSWALYHILEHFATHYGQILLMKHLMRDAGVLPKEQK
ncbi:MAG: DinB family protein, partial [candidate division Zixibacteria bacterium]|nr:DinB family protein [candidate division Zixibacteria bacterium]